MASFPRKVCVFAFSPRPTQAMARPLTTKSQVNVAMPFFFFFISTTPVKIGNT